jgi:hypothetical protein
MARRQMLLVRVERLLARFYLAAVHGLVFVVVAVFGLRLAALTGLPRLLSHDSLLR